MIGTNIASLAAIPFIVGCASVQRKKSVAAS